MIVPIAGGSSTMQTEALLLTLLSGPCDWDRLVVARVRERDRVHVTNGCTDHDALARAVRQGKVEAEFEENP